MNLQYIEYLRGCVSTALADTSRSGKGQLLNGSEITRTTVHTRKRRRIVQLEGRKVCATTDAMHCPETRSKKKAHATDRPYHLRYSFMAPSC